MKTTKNKIILEMKKSAEKMGVNFEFIRRTYYLLKKDGKEIMFTESMPETTNAIVYRLTENKFLMNQFLRDWNFPAPEMERYSDIEQAKEFLNKYGKIVVKPERGMHGKGITVGLTKNSHLKQAIDFAKENDPYKKVVLEKFQEGDDYRALVIGRKKVFVAKKEPAHIIGDGENSVEYLLKKRNEKLLKRYHVKKDEVMTRCLKEQKLSVNDIVEKNRKVYLKRTANIKSGGTPVDYTDKISPQIKKQLVKIANKLKIDVAGFDVMTKDIAGNKFTIIEINSYPGLLLHIYPTGGKSHNVADEIVKYFFFPEKF